MSRQRHSLADMRYLRFVRASLRGTEEPSLPGPGFIPFVTCLVPAGRPEAPIRKRKTTWECASIGTKLGDEGLIGLDA